MGWGKWGLLDYRGHENVANCFHGIPLRHAAGQCNLEHGMTLQDLFDAVEYHPELPVTQEPGLHLRQRLLILLHQKQASTVQAPKVAKESILLLNKSRDFHRQHNHNIYTLGRISQTCMLWVTNAYETYTTKLCTMDKKRCKMYAAPRSHTSKILRRAST